MTAKPPSPVQIHVVYPPPGHPVFEDSTFVMGGITGLGDNEAHLSIYLSSQGNPVPVSTQGFFAWKIPIHAGMNPVQLSLRHSPASPPLAQAHFALYGVPPLGILPALPLAVHAGTLQPAADVWLSEADCLTVACSASIGAQISFSIPGWLDTPLPLTPLPMSDPYLDTRERIFSQRHWTQARIPTPGYYQAVVSVTSLLQATGATLANAPDRPLSIRLHLQHGEHTLQQTLSARLTLLKAPRTAVLQGALTITRTAPGDGSPRLTPQVGGATLSVDGLQAGWARARLNPQEAFYLPLAALTFPSVTHPPALHRVAGLSSEAVNPSQSVVTLGFTRETQAPGPLQLDVLPTERLNRLQIKLYGVATDSDALRDLPNDTVIRQIHWRPVAPNTLELWIDLAQPLAGYDYAWDGPENGWRFTVKTLPPGISQVRVLIDPGHGGPETGATGLNGLPEKNLNLVVSRLLRDALQAAGFQVRMTRDEDIAVSLAERARQAVSAQADMVLSIHHNALPDGRDPLENEGTCTFYYHAFSKPLAQALLNGLTDNTNSPWTVPSHGLFDDSLAMTRIHQSLAVLVEIGFFTHPAEFERLIDPAFQREVAQRLARALKAYCLSAFAKA